MRHINCDMPLFQHPLFTIDLAKVIAANQNLEDPALTIRTDDQRKLEVATESAEQAAELLETFAAQWQKAVGPLLRHEQHAFLASAIYSIQVEGEEVFIYFRDHSISFGADDTEGALGLLADLTRRWQMASGEAPA